MNHDKHIRWPISPRLCLVPLQNFVFAGTRRGDVKMFDTRCSTTNQGSQTRPEVCQSVDLWQWRVLKSFQFASDPVDYVKLSHSCAAVE